MIIKEEYIDNLDTQALSVVPTKTLFRRFGKTEDYIELLIYDLNGRLLFIEEDFRGYTIGDDVNSQGLYNDIKLDYKEVLRYYGFTRGKYKVVLNFYRKAILNSKIKPFYISEISPSRREIKIKSDILPNNQMSTSFEQLIGVLDSSGYFREYILNFGNNTFATAINFTVDTISDPTEVLIKLFDPLPNNINIASQFSIAEELINPLEVTVDLGSINLLNTIEGESLKGPNYRIDTRLNSSKASVFRTYDDILGGSISSSFSNIDNYLSGGLELAIDFEDADTETGYTFENFIHFGSAVEKLKNFRYKLQLIENYDSEISDIDGFEGDQTASIFVIGERATLEKKKKNIINTFDPYERFLYYESSSYTWPKTNSSKPYTLATVNSNEGKEWIGSEYDTSGYYGGQLLLASEYDGVNIHRLVNTLPEHILSNPDNDQAVLFVNMIAEHFDKLWIYMNHMTKINQAENKLNRGVSKNLVFDVLERAGVKVFDQFENENLFSYIAGDYSADGTFQYQAPTSQSMVSASNAGSISKGDITYEVWKRLYHNLPYLLKTKGTERGLKALISCYGIPESVLHVKEYGGPVADKTTFRTFTYQKASKLTNKSTNNSSTVVYTDLYSEDVKTIQTRILPTVGSYDIINLNNAGGDLNDISIGISQSLYNTLDGSGSFAYLVINSGSSNGGQIETQSTSSIGPLFNGGVWNISVILNSGSVRGNNIEAYATYTTQNKNTYVLSCSLDSENYFNEVGVASVLTLGSTHINHSVYGTLLGPCTASFQEFRVWTEKLTLDTITNQSLSPFNYNGNTVSSSYENLICRLPLGSNDITPSNPIINYVPNPTYQTQILSNLAGHTYANTNTIELLETHHLTTPDTVGKSMVSDKVRLDTGVIADDILSPFIRSEDSIQDRQPNDFSDLGVFFSPTFEVNEDIIYTLGGFRLDDYIGDPRHYTSGNYPDLEELKEIYTQKIVGRITNIWDYMKLIQYFDHTLFKMIEQFVPAKTNLKTGLVIEPHYLERHKIKGTQITTDTSYNEFDFYIDNEPTVSSEYQLTEADINVYEIVTEGSRGSVENNAIWSKRSNRFYNRIAPFAQTITTDSGIIIDNDGDPVPPSKLVS